MSNGLSYVPYSLLDRWTGKDNMISPVSEGGICNGRPLDVWTGQDSGTSLVS